MNKEAKVRHERQYRVSHGNPSAVPEPTRHKKPKRITEEYSMYEEDEKIGEDDELEDIIEEEAQDEESDESDGQGRKKKKTKADSMRA